MRQSWTEPFYLPLMLASFIATAAAADAAQNGRFARAAGLGLLAGLLAGMCYLLRYAGISIIAYQGAFLLVMALIESGHARPKRARDGLLLAGAYTLAPMLAVGAWATRNWLVGGAGLGRRHGWHPPSPDHWDTARLVMEDWFVPGSRMAGSIQSPLKAVLIIAAIAGALLVTIALAPRAPATRSTAAAQSSFWRLLPPMLMGYFVVYLAFLLVTVTIYDYATYPDGRILLPAFMCFVIGLYSLAGRWRALDGVGRAWEVTVARGVTLTFSFLLIANTVAPWPAA